MNRERVPTVIVSVAWWASIRDSLTRPWPGQAAHMDLRVGQALGELVNHQELATRWGWTPGKVRGFCQSLALGPVRSANREP